jgi:DNA-binding HxlR family transcriptional regulator
MRVRVETGNALRETSDGLLRDLDVLVAIEEEKRSLEPGDARLVELAARVEEIAQRILEGTVRQRELTQVVRAQVEAGSPEAPDAPIEHTPRSIQAVLADWRDAERRAAAAEPGSADALEADALVTRLRDEYRRAHEAIRRDR